MNPLSSLPFHVSKRFAAPGSYKNSVTPFTVMKESSVVGVHGRKRESLTDASEYFVKSHLVKCLLLNYNYRRYYCFIIIITTAQHNLAIAVKYLYFTRYL